MSRAVAMECQSESLLADDETWVSILEPSFVHEPQSAESLARLLFAIKEAIESGPDGVTRASRTLLHGIRLVYLYTDAHQAALKLYELSLTGHLQPQHEPLQLICPAIERGTCEVEQSYAAERRRKNRVLKKGQR